MALRMWLLTRKWYVCRWMMFARVHSNLSFLFTRPTPKCYAMLCQALLRLYQIHPPSYRHDRLHPFPRAQQPSLTHVDFGISSRNRSSQLHPLSASKLHNRPLPICNQTIPQLILAFPLPSLALRPMHSSGTLACPIAFLQSDVE